MDGWMDGWIMVCEGRVGGVSLESFTLLLILISLMVARG